MDYGSDQDFRICDGIYNLATPWGRNGWVKDFRIDNVGFKPDVRIPEGEKDWGWLCSEVLRRRKYNKKIKTKSIRNQPSAGFALR